MYLSLYVGRDIAPAGIREYSRV